MPFIDSICQVSALVRTGREEGGERRKEKGRKEEGNIEYWNHTQVSFKCRERVAFWLV